MTTLAARALLVTLIDYAGLFPPAELPMAEAVSAYAAARSGREAWMLGRFVLPLARLEEFERAAGALPGGRAPTAWPLSVIGSGDGRADAATIAAFNGPRDDAARPDARIEAIEMRVDGPRAVAGAADLAGGLAERFFELDISSDPSATLAAVARAGGRAKVRTGGVTADRFPSVGELARFLESCAAARVAFKATAGLHHPLRSAHAPTGDGRSQPVVMHGFLNVMLAAALAFDGGARAADLEPVLAEPSPAAFAFDAAGVVVKGRRLTVEALASARRSFALSFGSCSFDDPVSELKALGIL